MYMTKSELATTLVEKRGLSLKVAELVVNTIFDSMAEAMKRGARIEIRGFGSFVVKEYDAYEGRNPKTGAKIHVPPKRSPFFKVGKELREMVDGKTPKTEGAPPAAGTSTPSTPDSGS
jgi:integration host factor subunit beta